MKDVINKEKSGKLLKFFKYLKYSQKKVGNHKKKMEIKAKSGNYILSPGITGKDRILQENGGKLSIFKKNNLCQGKLENHKKKT